MAWPIGTKLRALQEQVEQAARDFGLDFFNTCFELIDHDEMNMIAAYHGFPVRYPHWRFGMEYDKLCKNHEYGLSRIYEMVINHDPCYAYLLDSNAEVDQKIVMCHVIGHNDFFKNNCNFRNTNRRMIDEMANHATRIRRYMDWYGVESVESFIDYVLSLENLIDCQGSYLSRVRASEEVEDIRVASSAEWAVYRIPFDKEYMENYVNPPEFLEQQRKKNIQKNQELQKFPKEPIRDVLAFFMHHAPLTRWQRDVMDMLQKEAYYFLPQAMTKIMNEGWASYWHSTLMTSRMMEPSDLLDYADRHSAVVAMQQGMFNPYKLGLELFKDIEERWNKGQFGKEWEECDNMAEKRCWDRQLGLGREKIFQVRQLYSDVMFIDEFFTHDFCKRHGFFVSEYDSKKGEFVVSSNDFEIIKKKLLNALTNLGQPLIEVVDANFENRSELLLEHRHYGQDLEAKYIGPTLQNLSHIWKRSVHLITTFEERRVLLSYDRAENKLKERILSTQV